MEAAAIEGWVSKRSAPETIDKQGWSVEAGPKTSRIAFDGLEDPRFHVRARWPQKHMSVNSGLVRLDGRDYLPVTLKGNSNVLVEVDDLSKRLHFSGAKLEQVAVGERSLSELLAKRIRFSQVLDSYSKFFKAYEKESTSHEEDRPADGYVRLWDPVYDQDMSRRALMKIVRRAERGLSVNPDGHHFQSGDNKVLTRHADDGLQLTLWSGHPFVNKHHTKYVGHGSYVQIQRVFHMNAWKTAALKNTYTRGRIASAKELSRLASISVDEARERLGEEGMLYHFQELETLEYIHSLPNVPRAILPKHLATYDMDVNGKRLLGTVWPYYPIDLTDAIIRVLNGNTLPELAHGGLEERTRRELLEAFLELLEALQFLRDVAHVVHGDFKADNILCHEDEDGKIHFVIGDWGGAKHISKYDISKYVDLLDSLGGSSTRSWTASSDYGHITKAALDIKLAAHFDPYDQPKLDSLQQLYNALQHGRDLLGCMLTAHLALGFSRAHETTYQGYIDFTNSFGRNLVGYQRNADQRVRRELYGKEIKAVLQNSLVANPNDRMSLDKVVNTIREVLAKANARPDAKLAQTLDKLRYQH